MLDCIIIGGSSAGLSAALNLGRALRDVVVLDTGEPCNRFSHASHGFLTQDGTPPAEIIEIGRQQLATYETVRLYQQRATSVTPIAQGFEVGTADSSIFQARTIILATGVRDELPSLEGIQAFWGRSVFHCPYCDGYEVRHKSWAVYGTSDTVLHQAMVLSQWTRDLTICTDGVVLISPEQRQKFAAQGIQINETPIVRLRGEGAQLEALVFADESELACQALFIRPTMHHPTSFAADLGCDCDDWGLIKLDPLGRTSVKGVYAAGDIANPRRSVAMSVAQGATASHAVNFDLLMERFNG